LPQRHSSRCGITNSTPGSRASTTGLLGTQCRASTNWAARPGDSDGPGARQISAGPLGRGQPPVDTNSTETGLLETRLQSWRFAGNFPGLLS
jgi:hypothetical protein